MPQRTYTKQELAMLYFPNASSTQVACAHLRRWIVACEPLHRKLVETGYNRWTKEFYPVQVNYVFSYLGEP